MVSSTVVESKVRVVDPTRGLKLALAAARTATENNGQDILVLDLRKQTPIFDYFVLATGRSGRQLRAISDEIDRTLQVEMGDRRLHIEGYSESRWIVLDYADVVIQLFTEEAREYYRLEDLWADGIRVEIDAARRTR